MLCSKKSLGDQWWKNWAGHLRLPIPSDDLRTSLHLPFPESAAFNTFLVQNWWYQPDPVSNNKKQGPEIKLNR